jgi:hypothetical protein
LEETAPQQRNGDVGAQCLQQEIITEAVAVLRCHVRDKELALLEAYLPRTGECLEGGISHDGDDELFTKLIDTMPLNQLKYGVIVQYGVLVDIDYARHVRYELMWELSVDECLHELVLEEREVNVREVEVWDMWAFIVADDLTDEVAYIGGEVVVVYLQ